MKNLCGSKSGSLLEFYQEIVDYLKETDIADHALTDIYGSGSFLQSFEKELCIKTGLEDAIFLPSGVMAQLIAMRIYSDESESKRFLCHETSHLNLHEEKAYQKLHQLESVFVGERSRIPLVEDLEEIEQSASALIYELPMRHLGGDLPSLSQFCEIKSWCKEKNIKLHIDGARIFETLPYYGVELDKLLEGVDSLFISFYKGFASTSGSMLLGSKDFIKKARVWLRRHGGNLYQMHSLYLPAKISYDKRVNSFARLVKKNKEVSQLLHHEFGIEIIPKSPQTNMFHALIPLPKDELLQKLSRVKNIRANIGVWDQEGSSHTRIEFTTGECTLELNDDDIKRCFNELFESC